MGHRKMKILLISHEMTFTGAPNSLLNVARVLRKHGHSVAVKTLHKGEFEKKFRRYGFWVKYISPDMPYQSCKKLALQYDLVICNTVFCSRICCVLQEYTKAILYLREAEDLPQILSDNKIDESYIRNAENVVCVSEYAARFIEKTYRPKKIWVLNNFLMTKKSVRPTANKIYKNKLHFFIAATIEPRKGIDVAVKAFKSLPEHLSQKAVLDIAGKKPDWAREYWRNLFKGAGSRIIYHGELTKSKKRMYKKENVVLVPSFDESCSLAALEGARYGRPVAVTENVGAKYLTYGGGGFVVKTGSVQELANVMRFFIENMSSIDMAGMAAFGRFKATSMQDLYYEGLKKIILEVS